MSKTEIKKYVMKTLARRDEVISDYELALLVADCDASVTISNFSEALRELWQEGQIDTPSGYASETRHELKRSLQIGRATQENRNKFLQEVKKNAYLTLSDYSARDVDILINP